jgi:hypothetical protein
LSFELHFLHAHRFFPELLPCWLIQIHIHAHNFATLQKFPTFRFLFCTCTEVYDWLKLIPQTATWLAIKLYLVFDWIIIKSST